MLEELFTPFGCTIKRVQIPNSHYYTYTILSNRVELNLSFVWDSTHKLEQVLKPNINKFFSIISNGAKPESHTEYNESKLNEFIESYYLLLTPEEKLDSVLEYISKSTLFDGQSVEVKIPNKITIAKLYFNNSNEWSFYLENAREQGYIKRQQRGMASANDTTVSTPKYNLTVSGLSRLIKINEIKASRFCFVAMAFTAEMNLIYSEAIEPAIRTCGFEPYIVNKINVESDKTINDAILAGIKKARFTIADFTYHRGGVYFEAGYALGRGQNVIYTCREDEMNKAHFDIRNYQHIVWSNAKDLKEKLINKIEAFIKN
ncbi:MAG: hypothetical protein ACRYFA_05110 [Janthinobacterium lividum]